MSLLTADPSRIDPEWMTRALREAGLIDQARVVGLVCTPVGNGLVGDSYRFHLTYDGNEPRAPASVVGKFPAADPDSRRSGSAHTLYVREVAFYRELAATVAIHTPRPIFAEIDPATDDFTLILEDLAPARPGDQLAGCSIEDCRTALIEAAALHAPRWNDPTLDTVQCFTVAASRRRDLRAVLPGIIGHYKERYRGVIESEFLDLIDKLPDAIPRYQSDRSVPRTLQHADFRLDNILFDVRGNTRPMATLDWQTLTVGPGIVDVAYFLSAGVDPSERRLHEIDLVRFYHSELIRRGVRDYGWDQCWRDYRRYTLHGIMMGVVSALSVQRSERGDALFLKMTRGACAQALNHDSFSYWRD
ncbi:phosphotransferase [Bradyrhizobium sp. CER78]|uniref:phosphotransferase n=1 Tax=Bradyrhizobium sp. CER78 TaxID=3039162 RepID=UPI00244C9EB5|nr:phosphotransferase [Bradyrhizobium sp. CER78]MDH2382105.1 phosphotransferase [Bradyrhizobium sp. CER78]